MNPSAIDLRLLRSFVQAARLGSVTKAADALHLTQPALSQHLRELTGLIGAPLFDRVGRGVALTHTGAELLGELEPLLLQLDFLLTSVKDRSSEVRGALRVGAIDTYSRALVVPAVATLLDEHPQLSVSIAEIPAQQIDRGLVDGSLDVGVAFSHLSNADVEQRTLFEEPLMLICGEHIATHTRRRVSMLDVTRHRLALLNRSFAMRQQIDAAFARADLALDVRVEAANVDSLVRLTQAASFATIASGLAVRESKGLVMRPIAHPDLSRVAALRWRRGRSFSPAMERFIAALQMRIAENFDSASSAGRVFI
jgi:LysR family cyn operon transcriptional activator